MNQEFDWDSKTNSMILSSFFWGYIVTQLPSGYIANTRSAQKLLSCGVLVSSLLNLLIPVLAVRYGWTAVVCCRVATGLTQGCLFPCVQTLMSKWVPPAERARLGSFVMNAGTFGTVITMPLTGALCASRFGWPSAFYIFGVCGIAWAVLFFYMGSDMPSEHPTICPNEMRYIDGSLGKLDKTSAESVEPPLRVRIVKIDFDQLALILHGLNVVFLFRKHVSPGGRF
ncbi:putative inorganic phosphate cotransporter [Nasonia vitripennis]|uniref:Major facilitator superfamily (MFS) profile domain-containing protein n=1 Tax=Nasonia vitripennis TaxID=7425 RepID=A0A7M7TA69_NASVI|nr:putative inorganic phosphate cotransporter [Nasonia vitripennis]